MSVANSVWAAPPCATSVWLVLLLVCFEAFALDTRARWNVLPAEEEHKAWVRSMSCLSVERARASRA